MDSTVDGELHIHGYEEEVPGIRVTAGEPTDVAFDANRSGEFPIELHVDGAPKETIVGILTVHEP